MSGKNVATITNLPTKLHRYDLETFVCIEVPIQKGETFKPELNIATNGYARFEHKCEMRTLPNRVRMLASMQSYNFVPFSVIYSQFSGSSQHFIMDLCNE